MNTFKKITSSELNYSNLHKDKKLTIMELIDYLKENNAPSSAERYKREIDLFFLSVENPKTATYTDVLEYLGGLTKRIKNRSATLSAIKKYYQYLVTTGQRIDNPSASIKLRDNKNTDVQLQDLFKTEELEQLLERKERYTILKNRNKIIISLLIYQALTNGEIQNISLSDIDLEQGTIYIKAGLKSNERTLKLQPKQVFWLMKYLQEDRPHLLAEKTDKLIISKLGTAETGEGIHYLIETQKHLFAPRKLNPIIIRQSVITNLLKQGKDVRIVQAFAGHKTPSSTEKYKQAKVEQLRNQILKYHPLK